MNTIGWPRNGLTLVSLFAGAGGSSLGYKAAGYDIRLAAEWDKAAAETYRRNFPGATVHEGDIRGLSDSEALRLAGLRPGELDVLDGSPPCQGFSSAGERRFADPRNRLFEDYVRLLRAFRPRAMVMENVSGLARGKMRLIFAEMTAALKAAGFRVSCRLLNAWWYGVPQDRRRLVWIGMRDDLGVAPSHPVPTARKAATVAEALHISGESAAGQPHIKNAIHRNKWRLSSLPAPSLCASRQPVMSEWHQPQILEAWAASAPGSSYVGSFQSVRLDPMRPSPTQIASHRNWRWDEPRYLTLEEAKTLQGFPSWFKVEKYRLVGNSVPPPMAEAVGRHVAALLKGTDGHGG